MVTLTQACQFFYKKKKKTWAGKNVVPNVFPQGISDKRY